MDLFEGIQDPYILKAVFILGAGGVGKGTIASAMFGGRGLKVINQDRHLERFLKQEEIPLSKAGSRYDLLKKAQKLRKKEFGLYAGQRLGLIVDMTGWSFGRVKQPVQKLRALGYDVYLVFVTTSLKTALARNLRRERVVPPEFIRTAHKGAHRNLKSYVQLFGRKNTVVIDNDAQTTPEEWKQIVAPRLYREATRLLSQPVRNARGQRWIALHTKPRPPKVSEAVVVLPPPIEECLWERARSA